MICLSLYCLIASATFLACVPVCYRQMEVQKFMRKKYQFIVERKYFANNAGPGARGSYDLYITIEYPYFDGPRVLFSFLRPGPLHPPVFLPDCPRLC
ncbi:jg23310 [Pararge aegeria aegeria]|uniref:Jg23310 protein n=1 Tax=Pararge aegeria aegeria TaxID=348720 RepID=A0A8S4R9L4_9NEOP|nr:jg23310 [Pararge aegeria aegeria]